MKYYKKYAIEGVEVPTIEDYIQIKKLDQNFTKNDLRFGFEKTFYNPNTDKVYTLPTTPMETVIELWDKLEPLSAKEIITRYKNVEVRALAFKYFSAERFFSELDAELIDEYHRTVKQEKIAYKGNGKPDTKVNLDDIKIYYVDRHETYRLFRIKKETLNADVDKSINYMNSFIYDVYVLEMTCPSTGTKFYEYIDPKDDDAIKSAKNAVAWQLLKENGDHLSNDEYDNIRSET